MPGKLGFMAQELSSPREQGLFIDIRVVDSAQGAWITVDGRRVLNLCSNDDLDFALEAFGRAGRELAILR